MNKLFLTLLCSFTLFTSELACMHPVHVSIINVDYIKQTGTLNISMKIFTDDLILAVYHRYATEIHPFKESEKEDACQWIEKYADEMFSVSNDKKIQIGHSKLEISPTQESITITTKYKISKNTKSLTITAPLLFDTFYDQTNLVIVSINGKELGYRLSGKKSSFTILL